MNTKSKATLRSDGSAIVVLPTGEVAEIAPNEHGVRGEYRWNILGTDDSGTWGTSMSREGAYRSALYASARRTMRPARIAGFTADAARALDRVDRNTYTRTLKKLLARSTGHNGFSVRGGRGTAASWIDVSGTDELGRMWVAAIFGSDGHDKIPPTRGYRAWYAARAAGLDGSDIELAEHAWD